MILVASETSWIYCYATKLLLYYQRRRGHTCTKLRANFDPKGHHSIAAGQSITEAAGSCFQKQINIIDSYYRG